MTPDELRAEADRLEREGRDRLEAARALRKAARALTHERAETNTDSARMEDTSDSAQAQTRGPHAGRTQSASARSAIGKKLRGSDGAFARWLTVTGSSASQWAEAHPDPATGKPRWSASAVKSWASGARRPPAEAALALQEESRGPDGVSAVPSDLTSWPSGIIPA